PPRRGAVRPLPAARLSSFLARNRGTRSLAFFSSRTHPSHKPFRYSAFRRTRCGARSGMRVAIGRDAEICYSVDPDPSGPTSPTSLPSAPWRRLTLCSESLAVRSVLPAGVSLRAALVPHHPEGESSHVRHPL